MSPRFTSRRVADLPPYVFLRLQRVRDDARARGVEVMDLTVGNPTAPVSARVLDALSSVIRENPAVHGYPTFRGTPAYRVSVCNWYRRRFGVELDPDREVLPVLGSKEGLFHLMQSQLDEGDVILVPTPCYPAYLGAARLAGAEPMEIALRAEDGFRLRVDRIDDDLARRARMLLLNVPHNPTGAVMTREQLRDVVAFCRDFDLLLVSDLPYSELALDDDFVPPSVLELPGAREIAVEMQSLSKSHSMAGWRVGFCVGNADVIAALARLKSNADFGIFDALQHAATVAIDASEEIVAATRAVYRARRDALCDALEAIGWRVERPRAAMYVWTPVPADHDDDERFVEELFERSGVLLSPGSAFGEAGRGYVRMSLVLEPEELEEVARRIGASGLIA